MRRRRIIIFNDDPKTRSRLKLFFDARGYETLVFREPTICPVYGDAEECTGPHGCGDIAIMGYTMPAMNSADLLMAQQKRGCKLSAGNKAIIGGSIPDAERATLAALGSPIFQSPLDFSELEKWIAEREKRMDLERPVAIRRREERQVPDHAMLTAFLADDGIERVTVVNKSTCGICFRTSRRLMPNEVIALRADSFGRNEDAVVRWTKTAGDGSFLAGLSLCI